MKLLPIVLLLTGVLSADNTPITTTLTTGISSSERTLILASVTGISPMSDVVIDNEQILVCSVNPAQSSVLACSYGRGRAGSTAASHSAGAKVLLNPSLLQDALGNVNAVKRT